MKKSNFGLYISLFAIFVVAIYAILETLIDINFVEDETANKLILDMSVRFLGGIALVIVLLFNGFSKSLKIRKENILKDILFSLPCILVCFANFPISSLINGTAEIYSEYLGLFIAYVISIGLIEELLFRGFIVPFLLENFAKKFDDERKVIVLTTITSGAIFGLYHLFNLFSGASFPLTILQVGYTFLTGSMFTLLFLKSKNVYLAIIYHTLFDIGGLIIISIGSGNPWDTVFWILTSVCGVIATIYFLFMALTKKGNKIIDISKYIVKKEQ